jgi:hypothetical protein
MATMVDVYSRAAMREMRDCRNGRFGYVLG